MFAYICLSCSNAFFVKALPYGKDGTLPSSKLIFTLNLRLLCFEAYSIPVCFFLFKGMTLGSHGRTGSR